jgi:fructoselysine-6-P-deglycase FrlB-like protein
MDLRQEILDTPRALGETLEKGRPEFEALVRQTRWGDGPLYLTGSGSSYLTALEGVYAFEMLVGWPVVARPAQNFAAYGLPLFQPRSVLIAISRSGETEATLAVARAARAQGAHVLALTHQPSSALAGISEGTFLARSPEGAESGLQRTLVEQATVTYIALLAARVLKRHHPQLDALEAEFTKLPEQLEWMFTQLSDAAAALADALRPMPALWVVGGGFYHPTALQAARALSELARLPAQGCSVEEFLDHPAPPAGVETAALMVSGSRCRARRAVHQAAERAGRSRVFALTDANDRELADASALAAFLPPMSEAAGATTALAFLQAVACQAAGKRTRSGRKTQAKTEGPRGSST